MTALAPAINSPRPMPVAGADSPRRPLIDVARWVAIYAIVWLHAIRSAALAPSMVLTRFAVPFFVAACVFLVFQGVRRKPRRSLLEYARSRFVRIYLPFLVWSAVYLGFKAIKSASMPEQTNRYPSGLDVLWAGGFYHLWFMPFILVVSLAAFALAKAAYRREWLRWPMVIAFLVAGAAIGLPAVARFVAASCDPVQYMLDALPAAFWGAAVGLIYEDGQSRLWRCSSRFRLDVLALLACMTWLWFAGRITLVENLAGVLVLLVALRPSASPLLCRLGSLPSLAYGIYFCHLLPIKICESLATRRGLSLSWQLDLAIFLVSAIAATLLTWLLYRSRWTRWLVA